MALVIAVCSITISGGRASADIYEVQPGDTLSGIAGCLNVSTSVIQALNLNITSPDTIFAGQRIRVPDNAENAQGGCSESNSAEPQTTPASNSANTAPTGIRTCAHQVQAGDILGEIASDYGTDTATMISLNPSINPDILWVGQQLSVPCSANTAQGAHSQPQGGGDDADDQTGGETQAPFRSGVCAGASRDSIRIRQTALVLNDE